VKTTDVSYPRDTAERRLHAKPGVLTLDELAEQMSLVNVVDPVSVRDARPVRYSAVYYRGRRQPQRPHSA
jgi:hypothetical protein